MGLTPGQQFILLAKPSKDFNNNFKSNGGGVVEH